jgi:CRP/FNR family transcriptional regulator
MASRFGKKNQNGQLVISLPQTHEDIANLSGVSRETVSTVIKELVERKILSVKNKIYTVEDLDKLKKMSIIYNENKPLPFTY